ncbi:MAG: gliding motility-associated C-terminal domain-containing protein [Endomicrobiia bacterium]
MSKLYVKIFLFCFVLFFSIGLLFSDPPDPITDLKVIQSGFKHVKLQWTVPNSTQTIKYYEIKFATYQITESNYDDINDKLEISTSPPKSETTSYIVSNLENSKLYFFAIKSSTSTDKQPLSQINTNANESFGVPYNRQPTQFSLSTPTYGVVVSSESVELDWNDADDPDLEYGDYLIYEIGFSTFSSNLFSSTPSFNGSVVIYNITTSYYLLNAKEKLIDNTTYYWRVKVIDSEGKASWSLANTEQSKFVINHTKEAPLGFSLQIPIDKSTVTTTSGIFFDWEDSYDLDPQDSVKYSIFISSVSGTEGFNKIVSDINFSSHNLTSDSFIENTTYWWYVIAEDSFSNITKSSQTFSFIVNNINNSPIQNFLISPGTTIYQQIGLTFTLNPTFYWTKSSDPDPYSKIYYQLYISSYSDNPDVLNSIYTSQAIYTTYYFLSSFDLQDDTTYFWRLQIWDEVYGENVWSSTVAWFYTCVYLNSAELKSPHDNSTTSYFYPKFEWDTKVYGYKLNFSSQTLIYWTDSDTKTISGLSAYTTFFVVQEKLKNNTTYFWQVITHSNSQDIPLVSTTSNVFKFFVQNSSPTEFDLFTPSATIILSNYVTLVWNPSTEPDNEEITYTVFYSTDNFLTYFSSEEIKTTNYVLENLQDNTTYFWYVSAVDVWKNTRNSNSTFYFVVNHIPQNPIQFNLLFPSNNRLLTNTYTTFYWQESFEPDPFESVIYELKISTEINFSFITFSTQTTQTQFFLPKGYLLVNSTYYWIVVASSTGSGFTICTSTFNFKIINTPPLKLNLISPQNYEILKSSPIVIRWSPAEDLQEDEFFYELYYTTYVLNNIWISTINVILSSTEYSYIIPDPLDDTTYYFYIVAVDTYNNKNSIGPYTFWTSFLNQPPTKPEILSPKQNETVYLPYTIEWSISTDFDLFDKVRYTIQISTDINFGFYTIIISSIQETQFKFTNFYLEPNIYYLKIIAFDNNNEISFSTTSFVINRYYISISSPQNSEIIQNLPLEFYFSEVKPKYDGDKVEYKIIYSSYSNFVYKIENNLQNNYYSISQPPLYPNTYYWYVEVYYNNFYAGKSSIFSFIIPNIPPPAPRNVYLSTSNYVVRLVWDSINIENLWGYKIYSGYDINNLTQIGFTTSTYYIDYDGFNKNLFYMISCVNNFGVESVDNMYVRLYLQQQSDIYISQDNILIFSVLKKENLTSLKIERLREEENENYIYVYLIKANKAKLDNFSEISILKPQSIKSYVIQYYDGYNWINFPSEEIYERVIIKTQYLGKYRLVSTTQEFSDNLTIIGCSPKKRIITPNNDGINDYIEFHYKIGSFIEGNIYNVYGRKVCSLKRKDNNILYFDAKDDNNQYLPAGVYIYVIDSKSDRKNFRGTIVIKY